VTTCITVFGVLAVEPDRVRCGGGLPQFHTCHATYHATCGGFRVRAQRTWVTQRFASAKINIHGSGHLWQPLWAFSARLQSNWSVSCAGWAFFDFILATPAAGVSAFVLAHTEIGGYHQRTCLNGKIIWAALTYTDAVRLCGEAGARLCTTHEMVDDCAMQTPLASGTAFP
jgi:hypothetical protein